MPMGTWEYERLPEFASTRDDAKKRISYGSASFNLLQVRHFALLTCVGVASAGLLVLLWLRCAGSVYLELAAQSVNPKSIPRQNSSFVTSMCSLDTSETCRLFPCDGLSGANCLSGRCLCPPGSCAQDLDGTIKCVGSNNDCLSDTGGRCFIFKCSQSKGPTSCIDHKCLCNDGYCANNGQCTPKGQCSKNMGVSCHIFGCDQSRGPSHCSSGECQCNSGYCADNGECVRPGECSHQTGETCRFLECHDYQGPTNCVNGQCTCLPGYCARDGMCVMTQRSFITHVRGVNQTHPTFPKSRGLAGEVSTALCIGGGGGRSLSFAMGALRALEDLGLMSKFEAISSVSGGTWAAALYMFGTMHTRKQLLGTSSSVSDLTLEVLGREVPKMGEAVTSSMYGFLDSLATNNFKGDEVWIDFVASNILAPLKMDSPRFMASSEEHVSDIISRNPDLSRSSFVVPRQDRARVFVMNGALLSPPGYNSFDSVVSMQMSPDWTGSPFFAEGRTQNIQFTSQPDRLINRDDLRNVTVGGGFVESFAFGSAAPNPQYGEAAPKKVGSPFQPFSLATAVGISSFAVGRFLCESASLAAYNPVERVWPITANRQMEMSFELGDGGEIDNTGVLAMLQRGAKRIVWLMTTETGIPDYFDWCGPEPRREGFNPNEPPVASYQMTHLFGHGTTGISACLVHNQVFSQERLPDLVCKLQQLKKSGNFPLLRTTLRVLPNSWWGIKGNYDLDIIIAYLERSTRFEASIKDTALRHEISRGAEQQMGMFKHWPFFRTAFQNSPEVVMYTNEQVNLLAAYGEYVVSDNENVFSAMLG